MQETVRGVDMMFIQCTPENKYTVELSSKQSKNMRLNFANVEGIELNTSQPLNLRNSYIQMSDGQPKMWNMRFSSPVNLRVRYAGKIIIEVI
jgi:hypothetical protein